MRDFWLNGTSMPWICSAEGAAPDAGGSGATDPPAPQADVPADPPAPDAPAAAGPDGTDPDADQMKLPVWVQKQMDRQHRRITEREAELAEARAENERLKELAAAATRGTAAAPAPQPVAPAPQPSQINPADYRTTAEYKTAVREEAERIAENDRFQQNVVKINEQGEKAHGKENWERIINNLKSLGGFQQPRDLAVILATDNPSKVLSELTKIEADGNPAYMRIMALPEVNRHNELVKLGLNTGAAPVRPASSNAPAPVEPINTRGTHGGGPIDLYDPKLADEKFDRDWYAARLAQKEAKFQARQARR